MDVAFIGNSWGANNDFFPGQIDDVKYLEQSINRKRNSKMR